MGEVCRAQVSGSGKERERETHFRVGIGPRPDESIVSQVATDVGGDDFSIYAIARYKVLVCARCWVGDEGAGVASW